MMVWGGAGFVIASIINFNWHIWLPTGGIFLGLLSIWSGLTANHHLAIVALIWYALWLAAIVFIGIFTTILGNDCDANELMYGVNYGVDSDYKVGGAKSCPDYGVVYVSVLVSVATG